MTPEDATLRKDLMVINELGLHARSAAKIVKAARQATGHVWLEKDGERVDAKQVIDILILAAAQGDIVFAELESLDDLSVLERIEALFRDGFGE